jgi:hypothetical protein
MVRKNTLMESITCFVLDQLSKHAESRRMRSNDAEYVSPNRDIPNRLKCFKHNVNRQTGSPCGGGLEYFHRNPCESQKATEREPSSLRWDNNAWLWVLSDSDHWQIALQITNPSSRQTGSPKTKSKAIVRQKKGKRKIWPWAPKGCPTPKRIGHSIYSINWWMAVTVVVIVITLVLM